MIAAAALGAATIVGVTGATADGASPALYENSRAPAQARAADLVGRMTLAEQIGKLYGDCSGPRGGRGGLPAVAVYRPQLRTVPRAVMTAEDRRGRLAELPDGLPD